MATPTPAALTTGFKTLLSGGAVGTGPGNVQALHGHWTNDTKAEVETAGYFNNVYAAYEGVISEGDGVLVFGDIDGTPWMAQYIFSTVVAASDLEITEGTLGGSLQSPIALTGTTAITLAAHQGRTLLMTGTGSAYTQTLPAATGSGAKFRFVVGAVNTSNHIITTTGGDLFAGFVIANSVGDTPDLAQPWPADQSDDDTITLNGTTTGGAAIGDFIEVEDIAADTWFVTGCTSASGTEATPFS